jgi:hypothetical protein
MNQIEFLLGLPWLHKLYFAPQKPQQSHGWVPKNYSKTNKHVVTNVQHPKIKKRYACDTRIKNQEKIFFFGFCHNIWKDFIDYHWDGNYRCLHWLRNKCFTHGFLTNDKGWYLFVMYNIKSSQKIYCGRSNLV